MATKVSTLVPRGVSLTPAQHEFLRWLARWNPVAYREATSDARRSVARSSRSMLAGLGGWWDALGSALTSIGSDAASAAKTVVPALLQYRVQRKVMGIQLARAQQGLAPLDVSQLRLPAMQVQVSPSPQVTARLVGAVSAGTRKTWVYAAMAILAVGGIWMMTRRAR